VPGYFGYGKTPSKKLKNPNIRTGNPGKNFNNLLTVPTHMWTQFLCLQVLTSSQTLKVVTQTSFIGLNYGFGEVLIYGNGITSSLNTFYANMAGLTYTQEKMKELENNQFQNADPSLIFTKPEGEQFDSFYPVGAYGRGSGVPGVDRIKGADIVAQIEMIEEERMKILGLNWNEFKHEATVFAKAMKGGGRMRRSIDDTCVEQNVTTSSLTIVDEDCNSNFKVKDCRIWEQTKEGELVETHVFDFERKVLIEDSNPGGSSLNATYFEDGVEEDVDEVPAPETEEEEIETISIVLRPRGN